VYHPENKDPEILSRKCFKSLSRGATPELACETLEQSDKVELDLDMVEIEPAGNLSVSKLLELVLFLPRSGVEIGVLLSDKSEAESDILECCKLDIWSDADKKENEELLGLEIFLDLNDMGELGYAPVGDGFMKLLVDKDGLTRLIGLTLTS